MKNKKQIRDFIKKYEGLEDCIIDKHNMVLDKTGKVLFMINCGTLNRGDFISKNEGSTTYVITRKEFNMDIYAIEYVVEEADDTLLQK